MPCCVRFLFPLREPSFQFPVALMLTSKDNHSADVVVSMVTTNLSLLSMSVKPNPIETKNLDIVYMDLLIAVLLTSLIDSYLFILYVYIYFFCSRLNMFNAGFAMFTFPIGVFICWPR